MKKKRKINLQNSIKSKAKIPSKLHKKAGEIYFLIFIVLTVFINYGNTFSFDYAYDDDVITQKNVYVQKGISAIPDIFTHSYTFGFDGDNQFVYRPIVIAMMAIETSFFGNNPSANHIIQVSLYAFLCILLFYIVRNLFPKENIYFWTFIILLFATHPIHTEVVANIKSRDELLSFIFLSLTLLLGFYHLEKQKNSHLVFSAVCYFLSLLCKESSLTFIVIIPLILYYFSTLSLKSILNRSIYYMTAVLLYFIIRGQVLEAGINEKLSITNNSLAAAQNSVELFTTKIFILGHYIFQLFIPLHLSHDYSYNQIPIQNAGTWQFWISMIIILGSLTFAFFQIKTRNPKSFAILYFFITMSLTTNFITMISSSYAERFMFLPSFGFVLFLGLTINSTYKKIQSHIHIRWYYICCIAILGLYSLRTISRNPDWRNNMTLFSAGVITAPNSFRTHAALGDQYRISGERETNAIKRQEMLFNAISEYKRSTEIYQNTPPNWYNMGVCYFTLGEKEKAVECYKTTLQYDKNHKDALNNLGVIYFEKRDFGVALEYFIKVVAIDERHCAAYGNLAAVYHNLSDLVLAETYYEKSLSCNPNDQNVKRNYEQLVKVKNR